MNKTYSCFFYIFLIILTFTFISPQQADCASSNKSIKVDPKEIVPKQKDSPAYSSKPIKNEENIKTGTMQLNNKELDITVKIPIRYIGKYVLYGKGELVLNPDGTGYRIMNVIGDKKKPSFDKKEKVSADKKGKSDLEQKERADFKWGVKLKDNKIHRLYSVSKKMYPPVYGFILLITTDTETGDVHTYNLYESETARHFTFAMDSRENQWRHRVPDNINKKIIDKKPSAKKQ